MSQLQKGVIHPEIEIGRTEEGKQITSGDALRLINQLADCMDDLASKAPAIDEIDEYDQVRAQARRFTRMFLLD
jgi:hypothetical protein